mmetsp:Transcript_69626/g.196383  ORF Transcript_69626/g.196383 Transcript_69626/m.196383 type:complete len:482 (+) Transcript_69626:201-1646(+)
MEPVLLQPVPHGGRRAEPLDGAGPLRHLRHLLRPSVLNLLNQREQLREDWGHRCQASAALEAVELASARAAGVEAVRDEAWLGGIGLLGGGLRQRGEVHRDRPRHQALQEAYVLGELDVWEGGLFPRRPGEDVREPPAVQPAPALPRGHGLVLRHVQVAALEGGDVQQVPLRELRGRGRQPPLRPLALRGVYCLAELRPHPAQVARRIQVVIVEVCEGGAAREAASYVPFQAQRPRLLLGFAALSQVLHGVEAVDYPRVLPGLLLEEGRGLRARVHYHELLRLVVLYPEGLVQQGVEVLALLARGAGHRDEPVPLPLAGGGGGVWPPGLLLPRVEDQAREHAQRRLERRPRLRLRRQDDVLGQGLPLHVAHADGHDGLPHVLDVPPDLWQLARRHGHAGVQLRPGGGGGGGLLGGLDPTTSLLVVAGIGYLCWKGIIPVHRMSFFQLYMLYNMLSPLLLGGRGRRRGNPMMGMMGMMGGFR